MSGVKQRSPVALPAALDDATADAITRNCNTSILLRVAQPAADKPAGNYNLAIAAVAGTGMSLNISDLASHALGVKS
jgi:hypothetical protein